MTFDGKDYILRQITIDPAVPPLALHDGTLYALIAQGTLSHYRSDCSVDGIYSAGNTLIEPSGSDHVHIGNNSQTTPLVLEVVYVNPAAAPLRRCCALLTANYPADGAEELNRTGIDSSPDTKLAARRCNGASVASSMSGSLAKSCSNMIPSLQPGQLIAQTEMSSEAEGHVRIRCAADIEPFGVQEHGLVEICRFEEQQHLLTCLQLRAEEIGVTGQGSSHVLDRRGPPQQSPPLPREWHRDRRLAPGAGPDGAVAVPCRR